MPTRLPTSDPTDAPLRAGRAAPEDDDPDSVSLHDFIAILVRRWTTIFYWTAAIVGLALAYLVLATPHYTGTTSILLSPQARPPIGTDPTAIIQPAPDTGMIESQVRVIASDNVLRRVVEQEKLADDPEFVPKQPSLLSRILEAVGLAKSTRPEQERVIRAVIALGKALTVRRPERTYILDVDVVSEDPVKAARLANAIAAAYLEDQLSAKIATAGGENAYVSGRLDDLRRQLQEAEDRVEAFKVQNHILDANGKSTNEDQLGELNTELARARVRTAQAHGKYQEVQRILASGRVPDTLDDAIKSLMLERLRSQYADIVRQEATYRSTLGPQHPAYLEVQSQLRNTRQLISEELKRIGDSASTEYQVARAAEAQIAKQVDMAGRVTTTANQAQVQLRELQRAADADRGAYERFLRAGETIKEQSADVPTARVIAPATIPLTPSSPKRLAILVLALAAGIGIGIGNAVLAERGERGEPGDDRPPAAAPVPEVDGLPVIGAIPRVPPEGPSLVPRWLRRLGRSKLAEAGAPDRLFNAFADAPHSPFSEAVRDLRDELRSGANGRPVKVVLITSDEPGAGKSTIAVNLARAAMEHHERALVIDANPQNPSLGRLLTPDAEAGLIKLAGALRPLYRIGAGEDAFHIVPILPDEEALVRGLLGDAAIEPLDGIRSNFDFVIIDGPSAGVDDTARMIADAADHVLLVMPPATRLDAVENALDRLEVPTWKYRGTVLSMVDVKDAA